MNNVIKNLSLYEQRRLIRDCWKSLRSDKCSYCARCTIRQQLIDIDPNLEDLFAWKDITEKAVLSKTLRILENSVMLI
jgi:hypothetical protein